MVNQKNSEELLCEPNKDRTGWDCLFHKENGRWKHYGTFDVIQIKNARVDMPIMGKVIFDGRNCEIKEEKGVKILICKGELTK